MTLIRYHQKSSPWNNSIDDYQNQLNDLIKAGIKANLFFDKYFGNNFDSNISKLSELVEGKKEVDFGDTETQIIFVKTLSAIIEGSDLPLSNLADLCIQKLSPILKSDNINLKSINFEETFIKANWERKSFGVTPVCNDIYQDSNKEALYWWEVVNIALIDGPVTKDINLIRAGRALIGEKAKCLEKIIYLLNKASKTSHIAKFNTLKDKLDKIDRRITAHTQKEAQRVQVLKEKDQIEAEKLSLKQKQEEEKLEREKKRRLEIEFKKRKEQHEKERKKQEAIKLKQEQDEAKRKKAEERKREKEEQALRKREEEKRKKELELKNQKDNSQK